MLFPRLRVVPACSVARVLSACACFPSLLAPLTVALLVGGCLAADPVKTAPDVVIYDGTYPGWPWVAATPGGKLLAVWREGTQHMFSSAGRVMISQSTDGGQKWTASAIVVDKDGVDDRNAAILALSDTHWMVS